MPHAVSNSGAGKSCRLLHPLDALESVHEIRFQTIDVIFIDSGIRRGRAVVDGRVAGSGRRAEMSVVSGGHPFLRGKRVRSRFNRVGDQVQIDVANPKLCELLSPDGGELGGLMEGG